MSKTKFLTTDQKEFMNVVLSIMLQNPKFRNYKIKSRLNHILRIGFYDEHGRRFLSNDVTYYYKKHVTKQYRKLLKYNSKLKNKYFKLKWKPLEKFQFGEIKNWETGEITVIPNHKHGELYEADIYSIEVVENKFKEKEWILI